jgi:hypothetical protein
MPWDYVLEVCCNYIQQDSIYFVIRNIKISTKAINNAFASLINSDVTNFYHDDPVQNELINLFFSEFNIDVNLKLDTEWEWVYLDCFRNVPSMASKFYTGKFDSAKLNSEEFWEELTASMSNNNEFKKHFTKAFNDLKTSGVDLIDLIETFDRLGHRDLAEELLI